MSYTETGILTIPQPDPNLNIIVRLGGDILFSEIFNGVPQFYPGSSFLVEEVFEAKFEIYRPELIDIDFRWNPSKEYIGTWTLSDTLPSDGLSSEDTGFIIYTSLKLKRYSFYTIQANADVQVAEYGFGKIDNCNFLLNSEALVLPPQIGLQQKLSIDDGVFKYRHAIEKAPLIDRVFLPKIRYVGLYVNVGAGIVESRYTARVINGISADMPSFPITNCLTVLDSFCDIALQEFLALPPNFPTATNTKFLTFADAEAARLQLPNPTLYGPPIEQQYGCPAAPFTITSYWIV